VITIAKNSTRLVITKAKNLSQISVRLNVSKQGPPGPVGGGLGGAGLFRQVPFVALAAGAQAIPLGINPIANGFMQVFINGVLHGDASDYSVAGAMLTLTEGVDVYAGDHILVVFQ
jgi:hypothetical protein